MLYRGNHNEIINIWGRLYKTLNHRLTTQIVVKFNYLIKNKR